MAFFAFFIANLPLLTPVNPMSLTSTPLEFAIETGDESKTAQVFLILYARDINPEDLNITINNTGVKFKKSTEHELHIFEVPHSTVEKGKNSLNIINVNKGGNKNAG